ncbi:MAG: tetratricopeptide repeat protein [Thiohalomonadaceae bacterium]
MRIPALMITAFLAGCSGVPAQKPVPAPEPAAPAAEARPAQLGAAPVVLPANELTPGLMYELLAAEIALQRGDLLLAADNYLRAAWDTRDPRVVKRAVRIAVYARDNEKALEGAELWVELAPTDLEARQSLAALLIHLGRAGEAVPHLDYVLSASADSGQGFQAIINLLSRENDKAQAMALLEELIARRRDDPNALFAHAQMAFLLGRRDTALASVNELLARKPGWARALVLKSNILRHDGKVPEALETYAQAVAAEPTDAGLRLSYAKFLVEERRFEAARTEFEALARQLPGNVEVSYALGLLAMQLGDLPAAEREFRRLLAAGHHDEAAYALAQIAESRKDYEEARRWYTAVGDGPNAFDARVRVGLIVARTEGLAAGRAYLHGLREEFPDEQPRLYLAEGEMLRELERHAEAVEVLTAGLLLSPDNPELLYARAMAAERLDRLDVLEQDLRRILSADPENAQALNALGYTLADRTDRYEEALGYIRKALAQHPDDPAINDSMGWVMFRLGRYEEAETYLQKAAGILDDPEIAAHLGELYWVTGRRDQARQVWDEGLQRAPDNRLLLNVIERLSK